MKVTSSSHASRFEKDDMPATDLRFVNAACNVLQCLPDDLYDITIDLAAGEELDPTLVFPRHAIVRYEQSQPRDATVGVASVAPTARDPQLPTTQRHGPLPQCVVPACDAHPCRTHEGGRRHDSGTLRRHLGLGAVAPDKRLALNGLFQAAKRRARGYKRFETIRAVIFLIAGKLDFSRVNSHAGQPT